jgi:redox-regulated HSP33 family molecular chaperone
VAGYIRRCLTQDKDCVIVTVDTREILQTLMEQQEAYPSPMLHLARACVASLLVQGLNASIENESIELQWKLQGAFGDLNARSEGFGKVRGNIQKTKVFFPELDHSLGEGIFQCRKTKNQISSQGILPSQGQVYLDLQEYFENSEQKKCALGMSVNFKLDSSANSERPYVLDRAQGYLLHILPGSNGSDEILTRKMHHHLEALGPISEWALEDNAEAATLTIARMVSMKMSVETLEGKNTELYCSCNKDKVLRALTLLTTRERKHWLGIGKTEQAVEVRCEYCGKMYPLSLEEIKSFSS